MALIPSTQDRPRANLGQLRDPGLRVFAPDPAPADLVGDAMQQLTQHFQDGNDKAAASNAYSDAVKKYQDYSVTDGPLTQSPADMFGTGATMHDLHNGHRTKMDEIGATASGTLGEGKRRQMFNELWNKRKDQESSSMATHIAAANKKFRTEGFKSFWDTTDQKVGELANGVEQNWRDWLGASDAMRKELDSGVAIGTPITEVQKKLLTYRDVISGAAVRGWFKEQPDRFAAAEALFSGNIPDPDVLGMYNSLDPKTKDNIYRRMIDDSSKLATIANGDRAREKEADKLKDEQMVKDFYSNDELTADDQHEMVGWARRSPHVSEAQLNKMEAFARAGGREEALDNEKDIEVLERAIRDDEITTDGQMYEYIAKNKLQVSIKTARDDYLPMIESKSDKNFMEALRWGQSELGIISGNILSSAFKDPVDKAASLEADLRRFRQDTPDADIWDRAKTTVERLKKGGNSSAMAALPLVTGAYRQALASGDAKKISNARQALIAVMQDGGLVDPITASGKSFNPLTIIDQPRQ